MPPRPRAVSPMSRILPKGAGSSPASFGPDLGGRVVKRMATGIVLPDLCHLVCAPWPILSEITCQR
jgi:hypothetical protein